MKYGVDISAKMCEVLAQGMGRVDACRLVDISYETFTVWLDSKPEFSEAIAKAETVCKQRNVVRIQNASRKDWRAAGWWLERKYPDEFANHQKHELTGSGGGPIALKSDIDLSRLTDSQLMRLADALEKTRPQE